MSLAEAVAAAERLPEVLAASAAARAAAAALQGAARPSEASFSLATHSVTARQSLAVSLPLSWITQRGSRSAAGRGDADAAAHAQKGAQLEARFLLQSAWFSLAAKAQRASAQAARAGRLQSNAEAVNSLLEAGRVPEFDRSRARAEAGLAAAEAAGAEEEQRAASALLARLLGLEADLVLDAEPRPAPEEEPGLEGLVAQVRETAPVVLVQAARAQAASARVDLAGRLRWPGLGVEAGADFNDPTQPGTDKWIGIAVSVPFAAGPGLALAHAERDQELARLDQVRREAASDAESAWHVARSARLRHQAMENEVLPAAREAAEIAGYAYRAGRTDLFRLLDAERALAEAELLEADAYLAWGLANADLRRFTSREQP